jgi:ABC-type uncharacterized transport system permease subunit
MTNSILLGSAVIAYLAATILIQRSVFKEAGKRPKSATLSKVAAIAAFALHSLYVSIHVIEQDTLDFSLSSMTAFVSLILVTIYLLGCIRMEIGKLGLLVYPLTALSLLFSYFWGTDSALLSNRPLLPFSAFSAHVLVAILAYCLLAIATIQSLLFLYQERQIKRRAAPSVLSALPPLQTMEQLLFRLILMGFVLLTLALLSGGVFSRQIFGQPFEFNHHTILAMGGWFIFALLLIKRLRHGLRASQAAYWTLGGFFLIQLGYFGTKLINESLHLQ